MNTQTKKYINGVLATKEDLQQLKQLVKNGIIKAYAKMLDCGYIYIRTVLQ